MRWETIRPEFRGVIAIATWYFFNISTLISNKYIFQMMGFLFPFTFTAIHMLVCSICSYFVLRTTKLMPLAEVSPRDVFSRFLPFSAIFVLNILLGNVSLRWVPVSFMQTVKSSVPAFTVLFQRVFMAQNQSRDVYLSIIPVVGGVVMATLSEVNFNVVGFVAALVACCFTATQALAAGVILGGAKMDSVNLVYRMAPFAFFMLIPVVLWSGELDLIIHSWKYYGTSTGTISLLLNGLCAFALNLATFFAIKNTSPLSFTVAGNFKVILAVIISVMIFHNEITLTNAVGCLVATAGVYWYNMLKYKERQERETHAAVTYTGLPTKDSDMELGDLDEKSS